MFEMMGQVGVFPAMPKWHLAFTLASWPELILSTSTRHDTQNSFHFRRERISVDSACLETEEKVCLKASEAWARHVGQGHVQPDVTHPRRLVMRCLWL